MRVITRQVENQPLTVIIEYPEYDKSASDLIRKINNLNFRFTAFDEEKQIRIDLSDVYYIENVERKMFIYTEKEVYRFNSTMSEIEEMIKETDMVRISRTCIMNTIHLKEIRQVKNSHLEAVMDNDEMLIVSRKYLRDIKSVFKRGEV
ncbi:MAG: LytTR family transcriptional regulator [Lachnospiraceae bacterium]|nr:LytTR family transcriptional regulator [Lachnospiraceae bacterium]